MGMAEHHTDVPTTGCKPHTPFQDQIACWKSHLRIHALAPCHKGYNSLPQMSKGRRDDATGSAWVQKVSCTPGQGHVQCNLYKCFRPWLPGTTVARQRR